MKRKIPRNDKSLRARNEWAETQDGKKFDKNRQSGVLTFFLAIGN